MNIYILYDAKARKDFSLQDHHDVVPLVMPPQVQRRQGRTMTGPTGPDRHPVRSPDVEVRIALAAGALLVL